MNEAPTQPRPRWVRFALGSSSTRSTAYSQLGTLGLNLAICLLLTAVEADSKTRLGQIAFGVALAGLVLNGILLLWVWLAFRWVDQKGQWT